MAIIINWNRVGKSVFIFLEWKAASRPGSSSLSILWAVSSLIYAAVCIYVCSVFLPFHAWAPGYKRCTLTECCFLILSRLHEAILRRNKAWKWISEIPGFKDHQKSEVVLSIARWGSSAAKVCRKRAAQHQTCLFWSWHGRLKITWIKPLNLMKVSGLRIYTVIGDACKEQVEVVEPFPRTKGLLSDTVPWVAAWSMG